jgi:hypothetical protein
MIHLFAGFNSGQSAKVQLYYAKSIEDGCLRRASFLAY